MVQAGETSGQEPIRLEWNLHSTHKTSTGLRRLALDPGGTNLTHQLNINKHTESSKDAGRTT